MYENVSLSGTGGPQKDTIDDDFIVVGRSEFESLKKEKDEYRAICLELCESGQNFHRIQSDIEAILNGGAGK